MTDDGWLLPDDLECPECGEDQHLAAHLVEVTMEQGERVAVKADVICGVSAIRGKSGCGNQWRWEK